MRDCRIKAENIEFYLHKHKVDKVIDRYTDDISDLSVADQKRLTKVRGEYAFVLTDYLIQIGKRQEAQDVINSLSANTTINLQTDTVLWLDYLYHQGKANYQPYGIQANKEKILRGYDCLVQCYIISSRNGYDMFMGLAMQTLSLYFANSEIFSLVKDFDAASIRYINEDGVGDVLLAGNLAERALYTLQILNEPLLVADAWRTLASCYFLIGDASRSLECLNMAIANPVIEKAPDLHARINEQLSMTYAALDDKRMSDLYRNVYLDQQDSTRQDRQLEARVLSLQESTKRIWIYVGVALALFIILCVITVLLTRLRRMKMHDSNAVEEELELLEDELCTFRLQLSNEQRAAVEQRARISVVNGMLPLIGRMRLAISRGNLEYATELSEAIEEQNAMLTQWIKLRPGAIAPKIITLKVQEIFDIVAQNAKSFAGKCITLSVSPTDAVVKADRALTLFIVNTLADNARKHTPTNGVVSLSCTSNMEGRYAEIVVSDNGTGMTAEQLEHLFEYKNIDDEAFTETKDLQTKDKTNDKSHGFGLQNCRGIIDRYRKISSMFSVCGITAESTVGKGTTIRFRLPLVTKLLLYFVMMSFTTSVIAATKDAKYYNTLASSYGDSLYNANVEGRYADAMEFSDSCRWALNRAYTLQNSGSIDTLADKGRTADIIWWRSHYEADYDLILSMRNETAVAALALHDWTTYHYNNYFYTLLYKECTADTTLTTYSQTMERNELIANVTMLVVLLMIVSLIPIFWFVYLRHVLKQRKAFLIRKTELKENIARARTECDFLHITNNIIDNQLSTLKHETMYYPTRIRQLIRVGMEREEIESTVSYYRNLYHMLSTQVLGRQTDAYSFSVTTSKLSQLWRDVKQSEDFKVLINTELISYLTVLLKRHNGNIVPTVVKCNRDGRYVTVSFLLNMIHMEFTEEQAANLFTPQSIDVDFIVMRQILREIGNATMRYGCGIRCTVSDHTYINIILPFAEK